VITPDHKDLKIPKMYHLECPWPAAQRELYMINAYKVGWSLYPLQTKRGVRRNHPVGHLVCTNV